VAKSFKIGDRVRSTKWGKAVEKPHPYIGLEGVVTHAHGDYLRVKLDNDPVEDAGSCPFFPSELEHIKEGATN
jgi:hypothetical protein